MKRDLYVFNNGDIRRKDNTVFFETEKEKKYIPVEEINSIWIFGEVTINKSLLDFLSQKEICLHFFNYYGYYSGSFYPREHLNSGFVILKQAEHYLDQEKRMIIAREITKTAAKNLLVILKYYNSRGVELTERIESISRNINCNIKCREKFGKSIAYWNKFYTSYRHFYG